MKGLYLEDLAVGRRVRSKCATLSAEDIVRFARDNDPQFFHLDPAAAAQSMLGELVASGWQTGALAVKLLLDALGAPLVGGAVGADTHIAWRQPVRPGDALRVEAVVAGIKRPRSRPDRGFVSWKLEMSNQRDEIVQTQKLTFVVLRKPL